MSSDLFPISFTEPPPPGSGVPASQGQWTSNRCQSTSTYATHLRCMTQIMEHPLSLALPSPRIILRRVTLPKLWKIAFPFGGQRGTFHYFFLPTHPAYGYD